EQGERKTHEDYVYCGMIHHLEKRFKKAADACDIALGIQRDYAPAHRVRAEAVLELAEQEEREAEKRRLYGDALGSFDRYLLLDGAPRADVFLGLALAYAGLGNYAAAVGEYNHALRVKPNDAVLHTARGSAYLVLGDLERARKDFTEAIR